jgi:hypothetical protein
MSVGPRPADRVTWSLWFERITDGERNDYETHVTGPPPVWSSPSSAHAVPADVRAFAHYTGRANGADRVSYALADLADVTGYAETAAVDRTAATSTVHAEPID